MTTLTTRAAELRAAFDRRFAEPPAQAPAPPEDFLAIQVGGGRCAVRVREVSALVTDRPVTALPGTERRLLGLAGFRGAVVLVYDLAELLGHGSAPDSRWMMLTPWPHAVALAFGGFAGHIRVPAAEVDSGGEQPDRHVVSYAGETWPVLSIPSLLGEIAGAGQPRPQKEL
jgi:chemotaxis signal transduction protein